jgi:hypothetical protein
MSAFMMRLWSGIETTRSVRRQGLRRDWPFGGLPPEPEKRDYRRFRSEGQAWGWAGRCKARNKTIV